MSDGDVVSSRLTLVGNSLSWGELLFRIHDLQYKAHVRYNRQSKYTVSNSPRCCIEIASLKSSQPFKVPSR